LRREKKNSKLWPSYSCGDKKKKKGRLLLPSCRSGKKTLSFHPPENSVGKRRSWLKRTRSTPSSTHPRKEKGVPPVKTQEKSQKKKENGLRSNKRKKEGQPLV